MRPSAGVCIVVALLGLGAAGAGSAVRRTPIVIAVEKTRECVVNISTERIVLQRRSEGSSRDDRLDQLFENFFRPGRYERTRVVQPLGSGVILDERGLVVTNAHVIRRASNLRLSLADGSQFEAALLAADFDADVALLRIQAGDRRFKAVAMVRSPLMLGETVIALGNPFGLSNSVTSGIVSSLDREITIGDGDAPIKFTGLIQTSALINPGNSGGPLVDLDGELVGINSAIVDQAQGIGFAMSIPHLRHTLTSLLATPEVCPVQLGVSFQTDGPARVQNVAPDGPAAKAGLRVGDVIEGLAGSPVADAFDVGMALLYRRTGERLEVRYRRDGRAAEAAVVLAPHKPPSEEQILSRRLGALGQDVTAELARALRLPIAWGVLLAKVEPDGPADRAGLRVGDLLIQIGRYRVQTVSQAVRFLRDARTGDIVSLAIVRGDYLARTQVRVR